MCRALSFEWAMFDNFNDNGFAIGIKSRMSKLWSRFYDSYLSLRGAVSLNLPISSSLKNCEKNAILFSWASNCQYFRRHIYLNGRNLMYSRHFCGSLGKVAFLHMAGKAFPFSDIWNSCFSCLNVLMSILVCDYFNFHFINGTRF